MTPPIAYPPHLQDTKEGLLAPGCALEKHGLTAPAVMAVSQRLFPSLPGSGTWHPVPAQGAVPLIHPNCTLTGRCKVRTFFQGGDLAPFNTLWSAATGMSSKSPVMLRSSLPYHNSLSAYQLLPHQFNQGIQAYPSEPELLRVGTGAPYRTWPGRSLCTSTIQAVPPTATAAMRQRLHHPVIPAAWEGPPQWGRCYSSGLAGWRKIQCVAVLRLKGAHPPLDTGFTFLIAPAHNILRRHIHSS